MGQSESTMPSLLAELKPGDVVTHMYAPPPNAIIDEDGRIFSEVLEARRRGIWFDVANGRTDHLRWDTFDEIMATGFGLTRYHRWIFDKPKRAECSRLSKCHVEIFEFRYEY